MQRTPQYFSKIGRYAWLPTSKILVRNSCQKSAPVVIKPSSSGGSTSSLPIGPDQLESIESHRICVYNVKKYDRENYLAALCIKDKIMKRVVFALRAFNIELSQIRDSTTNSDRAKVRLHFWSRLIDEIVRRDSEHKPDIDKETAYYKHAPVAKELLDLFYLVEVDNKIQTSLRDMVGARLSSKVLGYQQFESKEELELYCYKSNGSLYDLAWRIDMQLHNLWHMNSSLIPILQDVCDELGKAQGLSNIIRGIPYNSTKNCCYIPKDVLEQCGLTNRDFVGKSVDANKIKPAVRILADRCRDLIVSVLANKSFLPAYYNQLFLPRVAVQAYLKRLQKFDHDVFNPKVLARNEMLPLSLKLATIYYRAPIF